MNIQKYMKLIGDFEKEIKIIEESIKLQKDRYEKIRDEIYDSKVNFVDDYVVIGKKYTYVDEYNIDVRCFIVKSYDKYDKSFLVDIITDDFTHEHCILFTDVFDMFINSVEYEELLRKDSIDKILEDDK